MAALLLYTRTLTTIAGECTYRVSQVRFREISCRPSIRGNARTRFEAKAKNVHVQMYTMHVVSWHTGRCQ
eukprot:3466751-Pleurochrysis_carterae.AAC.3